MAENWTYYMDSTAQAIDRIIKKLEPFSKKDTRSFIEDYDPPVFKKCPECGMDMLANHCLNCNRSFPE